MSAEDVAANPLCCVQVFVNDPHGEKPVEVSAVVMHKYPKVDVVIMKVMPHIAQPAGPSKVLSVATSCVYVPSL